MAKLVSSAVPERGASVGYGRDQALEQLGVGVSFEVENGTLPRLRYGHHYRLRARTVDLAGNGLTVDEAG